MAWHFAAGTPVYLQICSRIRADILLGVYPPDTQIPSVRQLACEAGVNPNTMQRAFTVLESEQLFVTRGTLGRFITTDVAVLDRARAVLRRETVTRILSEAAAVGISPAELIADIQACAAREDAPADNTVTERSDPT